MKAIALIALSVVLMCAGFFVLGAGVANWPLLSFAAAALCVAVSFFYLRMETKERVAILSELNNKLLSLAQEGSVIFTTTKSLILRGSQGQQSRYVYQLKQADSTLHARVLSASRRIDNLTMELMRGAKLKPTTIYDLRSSAFDRIKHTIDDINNLRKEYDAMLKELEVLLTKLRDALALVKAHDCEFVDEEVEIEGRSSQRVMTEQQECIMACTEFLNTIEHHRALGIVTDVSLPENAHAHCKRLLRKTAEYQLAIARRSDELLKDISCEKFDVALQQADAFTKTLLDMGAAELAHERQQTIKWLRMCLATLTNYESLLNKGVSSYMQGHDLLEKYEQAAQEMVLMLRSIYYNEEVFGAYKDRPVILSVRKLSDEKNEEE